MSSPVFAISAITGVFYLTVYLLYPELETTIFARGAAELAAFLSGSPLVRVESGWVLPFKDQLLLVDRSCSGATFFLMLTAVITLHLAHMEIIPLFILRCMAPIFLSLVLVFPINAFRILSLHQLHQSVFPHFPENWVPLAHLGVGIFIFLPSLILINLALQHYDSTGKRA
ncbi:MAG: hypothetical protein ACFCU4_02985 [Puniceicoccaceae bacterium]